jgi:hypothetical protein
MTLTVPKPQLTYDVWNGSAFLEKPVTVMVGGVGVPPSDLVTYGFLPFRKVGAASALEVWDDGPKTWKPDPGSSLAGIKLGQLAFKEGDPQPWQGLIVAAMGKDSGNQPQFVKAAGGFPQYFFRAIFAIKDIQELVASPLSDRVTFAAMAEKNRLVIGPAPGETADTATHACLILKDGSFAEIGSLFIDTDGSSSKITILNSAGAKIILHSDGQIELAPGAGKNVVIQGELSVNHITSATQLL